MQSDGRPLLLQIKEWKTILEKFCQNSFRKIRIRKKKRKPINKNLSNLIDERNRLMTNCDDPETKIKIDQISITIADEEAEENRAKIMENFKDLSEDPENINLQQMWKMCKRLWPKTGVTLPTAKRNHMGKIVTGPREIKIVLAKEYKDRLRSRPVRPDLPDMKKRKN